MVTVQCSCYIVKVLGRKNSHATRGGRSVTELVANFGRNDECVSRESGRVDSKFFCELAPADFAGVNRPLVTERFVHVGVSSDSELLTGFDAFRSLQPIDQWHMHEHCLHKRIRSAV